MVLIISVVVVIPAFVYLRRKGEKEEKQEVRWNTNPDYKDPDDVYQYYGGETELQIPSHSIDVLEQIGKGHFGEVCKGYYFENDEDHPDNPQLIAIKFSRRKMDGKSSRDEQNFHKEREILMKYGKLGFHLVYYYGWSKLQAHYEDEWRLCLGKHYSRGVQEDML